MSMEDRLALLPADLRELVSGLPPDKAHALLDQLIQPAELSFRPLQECDVDLIKVGGYSGAGRINTKESVLT